LDIDYKKYPKRPKIILINPDGQVYDKLDAMIFSLKNWNKKSALSIVDLIEEILTFIEKKISNEVKIEKGLLDGFLALCRNQHPREIMGFLRMRDNIFSEFVLPPGLLTSRSSSIFFPSRIPLDASIEGTIHSHPSGIIQPSLADLNNVFKHKRFHFIVGYPYNSISSIMCFDENGNEISFKIIK
jgi:proteasome lid subunit RPN8/RPN11